MNAPGKILAKSKISEWNGLDGISAIVHGMRCIWREQEKDDFGIDGEIELCLPKTRRGSIWAARHQGSSSSGTARRLALF